MIATCTAVSPERLRAANMTLHRAVGGMNLQESVRRSLVARATGERQLPIRLVGKPFPPGQEAEYSQMASIMCATLAWLPQGQSAAQYLAAQHVDTVLEIQIVRPGLVGKSAVNPRLHVVVEGRARLFSVQDGVELASVPIRYRGSGRKFTEWAADNARAFNAELKHCSQQLADQALDQLLVKHTSSAQGSCGHHRPAIASR